MITLSEKTDTTFSDIPILMIGDSCLVHSPQSLLFKMYVLFLLESPSWTFSVHSASQLVVCCQVKLVKSWSGWSKVKLVNLAGGWSSWWKVGEVGEKLWTWWSCWIWWKVGEVGEKLVKLLKNWWRWWIWSGAGQVGEKLVKSWRKFGKVGEKLVKLVNLVGGWSNWLKVCELFKLVKSWWKVGEKLVKLGSLVKLVKSKWKVVGVGEKLVKSLWI